MSHVETVLGPIDADQLGFTLSHEHVYVFMGEDNHHYPWMFDLDATRETAMRELSEAKAGGVDSLIDLTTPDLGREVEFVRAAASASGMNVVVATGIAVVAPHFAGAFVARPTGDRSASDDQRQFEFALTYNRENVVETARNMMSKITPHVAAPAL